MNTIHDRVRSLALKESVLDAEIQAARKEGSKDKQIRLFLKQIEVWKELIDLAEGGYIQGESQKAIFLRRGN